MSLDTADFPLVWMRQNGRDTQAELAEFSALLARAEYCPDDRPQRRR